MPRKKKRKIPLRRLNQAERQRQINAIRSLNPEQLNEEMRKTGILSINVVQDALLTGRADQALINAAALGAKIGGLVIDRQEVKNTNSPYEAMSDSDLRALLEKKKRLEREEK
jgi:hypothetical protein